MLHALHHAAVPIQRSAIFVTDAGQEWSRCFFTELPCKLSVTFLQMSILAKNDCQPSFGLRLPLQMPPRHPQSSPGMAGQTSAAGNQPLPLRIFSVDYPPPAQKKGNIDIMLRMFSSWQRLKSERLQDSRLWVAIRSECPRCSATMSSKPALALLSSRPNIFPSTSRLRKRASPMTHGIRGIYICGQPMDFGYAFIFRHPEQ